MTRRSRLAAIVLSVLCAVFSFVSAYAAAKDDLPSLTQGIALYKKGQYQKALTQFSVAIKSLNVRDPRQATAYYYTGCCYYQMRMTPAAFSAFQNVAFKYPNTPEAVLARKMLDDKPAKTAQPAAGRKTRGKTSEGPATTLEAAAPALTEDQARYKREYDALPSENRFFLRRTTTVT